MGENAFRNLKAETMRIGGVKGLYWVTAKTEATPLTVENVSFAGAPKSQHIVSENGRVYLRDMTIFAGHLTPWGAIRWGVFRLLKLGVIRRDRLRRLFRIRRKGEGL